MAVRCGISTGHTNPCWWWREPIKSLGGRGVEPLDADYDQSTRLFCELEVKLNSSKVLTTRWAFTQMYDWVAGCDSRMSFS